MQSITKLPVTIKTRIGYDDTEDYENLHHFISTIKKARVLKLLLFMQEKLFLENLPLNKI